MKMIFSAAAVLLAASAHSAFAGCDYTGNCYSTYGNARSGYNTYGNNLNTGSTWSSHTDPNGNQRGYDSSGNAWNYNAQTGSYYNYGTGRSCSGFGASRTCY